MAKNANAKHLAAHTPLSYQQALHFVREHQWAALDLAHGKGVSIREAYLVLYRDRAGISND